MDDGLTFAAVLLVAGPLIGAIGIARPALLSVWTAPRDAHLAMVRAHRRDWSLANAGFFLATGATAGGLAALTASVPLEAGSRAMLTAASVVYAIAGTLWCAVVAIRNRTTPALAEMVVAGTLTEPAEAILGAVLTGLFAAFMVTSAAALVAVGVVLALGGVVAAPVAWLATVIAAGVILANLVSREVIPAVIYFPTLLIGLALFVAPR